MAYADVNSQFYNPIRKRAFGSLVCVLILFYLGFHTISGERGVFALLRESKKLESLKAELAETKEKRLSLESKVQRLGSNSLDTDLLDEQARRVLGYSGKGEVILFTEEDDK